MKSNPMSKVGRDVYLGAADIDAVRLASTTPIVGPGSYTPVMTFDGEFDTMRDKSDYKADRGWSYQFFSDTVREWTSAMIRGF